MMLDIEQVYEKYGFDEVPSKWYFTGEGSTMLNTLENFKKVYPTVYKVGFIDNESPTKSARKVTSSWRRWAGYAVEVKLFDEPELGVKKLEELRKKFDRMEYLKRKMNTKEGLTDEEREEYNGLKITDFLEYSAFKYWRKFKEFIFSLRKKRKWYATGKFFQIVFQGEIGTISPSDAEVRVLLLAPWHIEPTEVMDELLDEFQSMADWLDKLITTGITVDLEDYSVAEVDDTDTIESWTTQYHDEYLTVPYGTTAVWYKIAYVEVVDLRTEKVTRYIYRMNDWWSEWCFEELE